MRLGIICALDAEAEKIINDSFLDFAKKWKI